MFAGFEIQRRRGRRPHTLPDQAVAYLLRVISSTVHEIYGIMNNEGKEWTLEIPPTGLYVWALHGAFPSIQEDCSGMTEARRVMDQLSWKHYYSFRAGIHQIDLLWSRLAEEVTAGGITSFSPGDAAFLLRTISYGLGKFLPTTGLYGDPTRDLMGEELSRELLAEDFLSEDERLFAAEEHCSGEVETADD